MKKLILILFMLFLFPTSPLAETFDYSSLTKQELLELVNGANAELTKRNIKDFDNSTLLYDTDGVSINMTEYEVYLDYKKEWQLILNCIVINNSGNSRIVSIDTAAINGWEVETSGKTELYTGHKEKDNYWLSMKDADVTNLDDIKMIELRFEILDQDYHKVISDPILLNVD